MAFQHMALPSLSSPSLRVQLHPQLRDLDTVFSEFVQHNNNDVHNKHENKADDANAGACSSSMDTIDKLKMVNVESKSDTDISVLPVEMFLKIFSYLDESMLFQASKVSVQWQQILDSQQEMWKKFTKKRWPLLERKTETTNWLKVCYLVVILMFLLKIHSSHLFTDV